LDTFGLEGVLELVIEGRSLSDIASFLGVGLMSLHNWLVQRDDAYLYYEAKRRAADACMDKALAETDVTYPELLTGPQVALMKLRHDHWMRRAGIFNAKFREKAPEDDAPAAAPKNTAPQFVLVIANNGGNTTIEGTSRVLEDGE
jgi:hypothetical protein